jgi:hypothetical protein
MHAIITIIHTTDRSMDISLTLHTMFILVPNSSRYKRPTLFP